MSRHSDTIMSSIVRDSALISCANLVKILGMGENQKIHRKFNRSTTQHALSVQSGPKSISSYQIIFLKIHMAAIKEIWFS